MLSYTLLGALLSHRFLVVSMDVLALSLMTLVLVMSALGVYGGATLALRSTDEIDAEELTIADYRTYVLINFAAFMGVTVVGMVAAWFLWQTINNQGQETLESFVAFMGAPFRGKYLAFPAAFLTSTLALLLAGLLLAEGANRAFIAMDGRLKWSLKPTSSEEDSNESLELPLSFVHRLINSLNTVVVIVMPALPLITSWIV